jgi:sigma-B regulation protein RsbQ
MSTTLTHEILVKCNVNLFGHGEQILVFAQSITDNQHIWRHQLSEFGKHFKCLTFDFVGVGKSDMKSSEAQRYIHIEQHLEDFMSILDRLKIKQAQFIGHGLGGNIGVLAVSKNPDLFKNMHLIDMAPKYLDDDDFAGAFSKEDFEKLWQILAQDYLSWSEILSPSDHKELSSYPKIEALYSCLKALRPDFAQGALRIKYDLDIRAKIEALSIPICFYHSLNEPVNGLWLSTYYEDLLPKANIQILNSEGRQPQLTAPDEVNNMLTKNLQFNYSL